MKLGELVTNPEFLMKLAFASGVWLLFLTLLPYDPLMAGAGFLLVGMPTLHWYAKSRHSQRLGRYRTPILAAILFAMWAGLLVGLAWAGRNLIEAFAA